jgi:ribose transport system substrate-binding protein
MKKKLSAMFALVACTALVLAGCTVGDTGGGNAPAPGAQKDGAFAPGTNMEVTEQYAKAKEVLKGKRIAFIPILFEGYALTNSWYLNFQRVAERFGADVKVYDANFDTDVMVKSINDIIAKKSADVLVIHNPDVAVLTNQIVAAREAGIYTVVVNMPSNQMADATIAPDYYEIGLDLGERVASDCKEKGDKNGIGLLLGTGTGADDLLLQQAITEVAEDKGLEIVQTASTGYQVPQAQDATSNIVQQYRDKLCGVVVTWDVLAISVGEEVKSSVDRGVIADDQVGVYAMGGDALGCDGIRKGLITASVSYDADGTGAAALSAVEQLLQRGEPAGSSSTFSIMSHATLDASNVDEVALGCFTGK